MSNFPDISQNRVPEDRDDLAEPGEDGDRRGADLTDRYLSLLERALLHTLYRPIDTRKPPDYVAEAFVSEYKRLDIKFERPDPEKNREEGRDWPVYAQTMVGAKRLHSIRRLTESVIAERVPGDLIEAGCWRGGVSILMRGVLAAHGVADRRVWVADSFQGLPPPDEERYPADAGDLGHTAAELAIPLKEVRANFERYELLDDQVRFVEGWFRDSLPALQPQRWALIRLDGDLYESTMDGLVNLYPQLSPGGYLVIDDYRFPNCRAAVDDYRNAHGIDEEVVEVDWTGAYWRKGDRRLGSEQE